jgi:hypothetical protein
MDPSDRAAARLAALSALIGDPAGDPAAGIARTLTSLAGQVRLVVPFFLGICVLLPGSGATLLVDAAGDPLLDGLIDGDIRSSLFVPTSEATTGPPEDPQRSTGPGVALILYAARPGALVDLAADLAWLTSLPLADLLLDQHLCSPVRSGAGAGGTSLINQAIGVLLGRGRTPDQAHQMIDERATVRGLDRVAAARSIISEPGHPLA